MATLPLQDPPQDRDGDADEHADGALPSTRNHGIGSWPGRRARRNPDRTAIIAGAEHLTYDELDRRVRRLAHVLSSQGVGVGDRVAYLGPNHPAFLETLFATASLGGIFVPLNTRLAAAELEYMINDAGACVLVQDEASTPPLQGLALPSVRHHLTVDQAHAATPTMNPPDPVDESVSLDDVCMIMYTSGTTGRPKGAMLTHGNLIWNCYNLLVDLDLTSSEIALLDAPLFHTAGLNHTALPVFLKGGTLILAARFDPEATYDLVEAHGVTLMFGVPAMYQQVAASQRWESADLSSLRILHCGGAPVPEPLIRRYQQRGLTFVQGYGMTEASPGTTILHPQDSVRKIGSAGFPHFFTEIRLQPSRATAPDGPRELLVAGPHVMRGYWRRPEDTATALAGGWLHTGDAAVLDEDGYVYIVDRIKDVIISGGENVYPAEVESALFEHPAVAACVVIGIPDERWGEVGRAVVVLAEGQATQPAELLTFLSGRLARYKVPRSVVITASLPRTGSGKIRRQDVRRAFGPHQRGNDT